MKHLKKYNELEEINEISKELVSRAAKIAREKSKNIPDYDKLGQDKVSGQYHEFSKVALGQDIIDKIEKLGYDVEAHSDYVILIYNNDVLATIYKDKYELNKRFNVLSFDESEKRKLITIIKIIQKNFKDNDDKQYKGDDFSI